MLVLILAQDHSRKYNVSQLMLVLRIWKKMCDIVMLVLICTMDTVWVRMITAFVIITRSTCYWGLCPWPILGDVIHFHCFSHHLPVCGLPLCLLLKLPSRPHAQMAMCHFLLKTLWWLLTYLRLKHTILRTPASMLCTLFTTQARCELFSGPLHRNHLGHLSAPPEEQAPSSLRAFYMCWPSCLQLILSQPFRLSHFHLE